MAKKPFVKNKRHSALVKIRKRHRARDAMLRRDRATSDGDEKAYVRKMRLG
jgi:hypothetical protein